MPKYDPTRVTPGSPARAPFPGDHLRRAGKGRRGPGPEQAPQPEQPSEPPATRDEPAAEGGDEAAAMPPTGRAAEDPRPQR